MAFDEKAKSWYNKALDEVKNELAGRMETDYGLSRYDDRQIVSWKNIEESIDKLKEE